MPIFRYIRRRSVPDAPFFFRRRAATKSAVSDVFAFAFPGQPPLRSASFLSGMPQPRQARLTPAAPVATKHAAPSSAHRFPFLHAARASEASFFATVLPLAQAAFAAIPALPPDALEASFAGSAT